MLLEWEVKCCDCMDFQKNKFTGNQLKCNKWVDLEHFGKNDSITTCEEKERTTVLFWKMAKLKLLELNNKEINGVLS
jgi:hypothetical protein